jgi:hypothetical protein
VQHSGTGFCYLSANKPIMKQIFCLLLFLFISTNGIAQKLSSEKTDALFRSWYAATSESYDHEVRILHEEYLKEYAKKNTAAIKNQWGISAAGEINRKDSRYLFLDVISKFKKSKDFFVIEAILSGEYVRIENYIVYKNENKTHVHLFNFNRDGWELEKQITIEGGYDFDPYQYYLPGRGTNDDNIVITHFNDGKVEKAFFYFKTHLEIQLIFNF